MPITLVNRSKSELTIYIGEDKSEKLVFEAGERKDEIDGKMCQDIEEHPFVKEGWLEVFGDPKADAGKKTNKQPATSTTK